MTVLALSPEIRLPAQGERDLDLVEIVPLMEGDQETKLQAASFIGSCLVGEQVEFEAQDFSPIESLYDAIHQAEQGNEEAYQMVKTNVLTDVVERTIKTGHITQVELMVDEAGKIRQFGQSTESIQANSLKYASARPEMLARTEAETINCFRIEKCAREGLLDDYCFVVFSRAADDMSIKDMKEVGFFTETMSCAIQVTSKEGDKIVTESAFVSGVKREGEERHDQEAIAKMGAELGVELDNLSATELLATPVMIHKSVMQEGVSNLVELYDNAVGGAFFGEDKPQEDYAVYKQKCEKKEASYSSTVERITRRLISEAPAISTPLQAVKRLHKLSEEHMVCKAVEDSTIDARVFGRESMTAIENARYHMLSGNTQQAEIYINQAVDKAVSSSCPLSMSGGSEKSGSGFGGEKSDKYGSLEFTCPKGHKNTRPHGKLIEKCQVCDVSVRC